MNYGEDDFIGYSIREKIIETVDEYGIEGAEEAIIRTTCAFNDVTRNEFLERLYRMYSFGGEGLEPLTDAEDLEFVKIIATF